MSTRTTISDARSLVALSARLRDRIAMHEKRLAQPHKHPRLHLVSLAKIQGELNVLRMTLESVEAQLRQETQTQRRVSA